MSAASLAVRGGMHEFGEQCAVASCCGGSSQIVMPMGGAVRQFGEHVRNSLKQGVFPNRGAHSDGHWKCFRASCVDRI